MVLGMCKFFMTNYCIDITRPTGWSLRDRSVVATTLTLTEKTAMQPNSDLDLGGEKNGWFTVAHET